MMTRYLLGSRIRSHCKETRVLDDRELDDAEPGPGWEPCILVGALWQVPRRET